MTRNADVLVVGAGMAGASVAAELSQAGAKVLLLETEDQPGFHSTGRSAAIFIQNYGNPVIRKLNRASRPLLEAPPFDPEGESVLSPRGIMFLADESQSAALDKELEAAEGLEEITPAEALELVPIIRRERLARAAVERSAMDIDVARLHQGYLRGLKRAGGELVCKAGVSAIAREGGAWRVQTPCGAFAAPLLVNAAGAWADSIARLAGLEAIGLQPLRRSAVMVAAPPGQVVDRWPLTGDADESFYTKPDGGKLMISPADETPVEPHDAWPEDLDLAEGIDRFQQWLDYEITHVERSWAGLRTFAPDRSLVIGFDPTAEGFFWLAGQGGYGIQTGPGAARLAAALAQDKGVPPEIAALGLAETMVSPARLRD